MWIQPFDNQLLGHLFGDENFQTFLVSFRCSILLSRDCILLCIFFIYVYVLLRDRI